MSADLAHRLKDHVHKMLFGNLRNEIDYRVMSVWGEHFEKIVSAHAGAAQAQETALLTAEKAQREFVRQRERALAVFNLFSGVALGWLSASLENIVTSYFHRTDLITTWNQVTGSYLVKAVESERKVAGKVFGETVGRDLAGSLVKLGASIPQGPGAYKAPDSSVVLGAGTITEMGNQLQAQLRAQKDQSMGMVEALTNQLHADTELGEKLVRALYNENPGLDQQPISIQERRGQESINRWLNNERKNWAKNWLYYANDPPDVKKEAIQEQVERELWVLWIMENRKAIRGSMTDIIAGRAKWFDSVIDRIRRSGEIPVSEIIAKRGRNRDSEIERLILWCWRRQPVRPTWKTEGTERMLTPIETFARPQKK